MKQKLVAFSEGNYLHLPGHSLQLHGLEAHALRDPQWGCGAVAVAGQRVARHGRVAVHKVHLYSRSVVLQRQQPLPHHRVALNKQHTTISTYYNNV